MDCPSGEKCIYSAGEGRLICMNIGVGPVVGGEVTSPPPPIGSNGLTKTYDEAPPAKESVATFDEAQFNRDPEQVVLGLFRVKSPIGQQNPLFLLVFETNAILCVQRLTRQ